MIFKKEDLLNCNNVIIFATYLSEGQIQKRVTEGPKELLERLYQLILL
jgi:hypothetical protein